MRESAFEREAIEPEKESKEIKQLRNHFSDEMEFLDPDFFESSSTGKIFELYQEYINQEPSFRNFKKLLLKTTSSKERKKSIIQIKEEDLETDENLEESFRCYLLNKLPHAIRERQTQISEEKGEKEIPVKNLLLVHQKRPHRIILGFHCSNIDIPGHKIKSAKDGEEVIEGIPETGLVFYSTDPKKLYGKKTNYLYFVEGYSDETKRVQVPEWAYRKGILEFYFKTPLTNEVVQELGLEFY